MSFCHLECTIKCDDVYVTTERVLMAEYMTNSNGEASGVTILDQSNNGPLNDMVGLPHAIFSSDGVLVSCSEPREFECTPLTDECKSNLLAPGYFRLHRHAFDGGYAAVSSWESGKELHVFHNLKSGLESGCKSCYIAVMDAPTC